MDVEKKIIRQITNSLRAIVAPMKQAVRPDDIATWLEISEMVMERQIERLEELIKEN